MCDIIDKLSESIYEFTKEFYRGPSIIFLNDKDYRQFVRELRSYQAYSICSLNGGDIQFHGIPVKLSNISCVGNILDLNQKKEK